MRETVHIIIFNYPKHVPKDYYISLAQKSQQFIKKGIIMKKQLLLSALLLSAVYADASFKIPFGAQITGAGSTAAAPFMTFLINKYNHIFPCPQFIYKQSPAGLFAGSNNGLARVLGTATTFGVTDNIVPRDVLTDSPDCILEIPFIITSLSIIYRLPRLTTGVDFTPSSPATWPGHLNISPEDLCAIYTGNTVTWDQLLLRQYNGGQVWAVLSPVPAFARADESGSTEIFARYLACSNINNPNGACSSFAAAPNPQGPFFAPNTPTWGPNVLPVMGSLGMVNAVKNAVGPAAPNGAIGYVATPVACAAGFVTPTTGSGAGYPIGTAGLFVEGSTGFTSPAQNAYGNRANYVQPTEASVHDAINFNVSCLPSCTDLLCVKGAYPIVYSLRFVLFATQPVDLIACNIAQFILFTLTEGQKIADICLPCGYFPLPSECRDESLLQLDRITSAICEPCIPPCNPCLNQKCDFPCPLPCK